MSGLVSMISIQLPQEIIERILHFYSFLYPFGTDGENLIEFTVLLDEPERGLGYIEYQSTTRLLIDQIRSIRSVNRSFHAAAYRAERYRSVMSRFLLARSIPQADYLRYGPAKTTRVWHLELDFKRHRRRIPQHKRVAINAAYCTQTVANDDDINDLESVADLADLLFRLFTLPAHQCFDVISIGGFDRWAALIHALYCRLLDDRQSNPTRQYFLHRLLLRNDYGNLVRSVTSCYLQTKSARHQLHQLSQLCNSYQQYGQRPRGQSYPGGDEWWLALCGQCGSAEVLLGRPFVLGPPLTCSLCAELDAFICTDCSRLYGQIGRRNPLCCFNCASSSIYNQ
jgi:hypothetical protein